LVELVFRSFRIFRRRRTLRRSGSVCVATMLSGRSRNVIIFRPINGRLVYPLSVLKTYFPVEREMKIHAQKSMRRKFPAGRGGRSRRKTVELRSRALPRCSNIFYADEIRARVIITSTPVHGVPKYDDWKINLERFDRNVNRLNSVIVVANAPARLSLRVFISIYIFILTGVPYTRADYVQKRFARGIA